MEHIYEMDGILMAKFEMGCKITEFVTEMTTKQVKNDKNK